VSSERASARRRLPPPTALFAQLSDPGCAGRAQGAGGGGARRRKRRARRGPSPEKSPLQLQPRVPSLPPAPQMRRWRRQLRKETPVLQRHSALLHRPPRAGGDGGGAVAAGSIGDPPGRCRHLATKICEESLLVPVIDLLPLNSKFTLFDCTVKMDLGLLK
uniref:Uncharacterized protein n=1 Tax=Balaenoptera musculus TaxID=9771 RepID=A0A8C0CGD4_BALMU